MASVNQSGPADKNDRWLMCLFAFNDSIAGLRAQTQFPSFLRHTEVRPVIADDLTNPVCVRRRSADSP